MKAILEVQHVTVLFPQAGKYRTVLDDVSLSVGYGESLGLVGASGAGKSTLAKVIARFSDVLAGRILFRGRDITHLTGKERRRIYRYMQMIFQSPASSFDPRRTLGSGIGESLKNRGIPAGERETIVGRALEQCGLDPGIACRYPHEVSSGQCQRAAVARAVAAGPEFILCDEATSSLDVTTQAQIIDLLLQLKHQNRLSFLFICHNLAVAQKFCDRIAVMHDGKIVEEGFTDHIISHPACEYTKQLIDAAL